MMEYYGTSKASSDFLAHYGIKGMKWGVRKTQKAFYKDMKKAMKDSIRARKAALKTDKQTDVYDRKYGGISEIAKKIPDDQFKRYYQYSSALAKADERRNNFENLVQNRYNHGGRSATNQEKQKLKKLSKTADSAFDAYNKEHECIKNEALGKYAKKKIRVYSPNGYRRETADRILTGALSSRSYDTERKKNHGKNCRG